MRCDQPPGDGAPGSLRLPRGEQGLLAIVALISAVAVGCGTSVGLPGAASAVDTQTASPTPTTVPRASVSPTPIADEWAVEICTTTQAFLDSFVYGEPYGIASADLTVEERKKDSMIAVPKIVEAARRVAVGLRDISPRRAGAAGYQRELSAAFDDLAMVYEQGGSAVQAARTAEELADVNARTVTAVQAILAAVKEARKTLPPASQAALAGAPGCVLLD